MDGHLGTRDGFLHVICDVLNLVYITPGYFRLHGCPKQLVEEPKICMAVSPRNERPVNVNGSKLKAQKFPDLSGY